MKYSISHNRNGESKMSDPCICGIEKKEVFCNKICAVVARAFYGKLEVQVFLQHALFSQLTKKLLLTLPPSFSLSLSRSCN